MSEGYSPDKWRRAKAERLPDAEEAKLAQLRADVAKHYATPFPKEPVTFRNFFQTVVHEMRKELRTSRHKERYQKLEAAKAQTKEGQEELAQQEAWFLNEALMARNDKLENILARIRGGLPTVPKPGTPFAEIVKNREERIHSVLADESVDNIVKNDLQMANATFQELLNDLRTGDLKKYDHAVAFFRDNENDWSTRYSPRIDFGEHQIIRERVQWWPTSPEGEAAFMKALGELENKQDVQKALELLSVLVDPHLPTADFYARMSDYYWTETVRRAGTGPAPNRLIKRVTPTRWLMLEFYDNGYIKFTGKGDVRNDGSFEDK